MTTTIAYSYPLQAYSLPCYTMADGLNMARAMRVSELMTDFRNIQTYMASIRASPSAEEYNEEGYQVLRHCVAQSHQLLQQGFNGSVPSTTKEGDEEAAKIQLQRYIIHPVLPVVAGNTADGIDEQSPIRRSIETFPSPQVLPTSSGCIEMDIQSTTDSTRTETERHTCSSSFADQISIAAGPAASD